MLAGVSPRDWVYGSVSHTEACLLYNTCLCTCMAVVVMAGGESLCLKILQTSECVCCFWITFLNLHFKWYEYYVFHMFLPFFFKIDDKVSHIRNCNSTLDTNFGLDFYLQFSSVQFSSVAQLCPTLCDPMNCSTPGLPVHHQLLEFTQTHVHRVGDAIQPSHPRSSPSPPAPNPSQHHSLFQWVNSSHEVAKVPEFQIWHHSLQTPRTDLL